MIRPSHPPTMLTALLCRLFGHRPFNDAKGHPFSTRLGICSRCGCLPTARR